MDELSSQVLFASGLDYSKFITSPLSLFSIRLLLEERCRLGLATLRVQKVARSG
jgi:hypothetical protein